MCAIIIRSLIRFIANTNDLFIAFNSSAVQSIIPTVYLAAATVNVCLLFSAVHFAPYLTGLSSMTLI